MYKIWKHKYFKYSIVLLCAYILFIMPPYKPAEKFNILSSPLLAGDTISCSVIIDKSLYTKGHSIGYLYELSKEFDKQLGSVTKLSPNDETTISQWVKLATGDIDMIIMNTQKDTVPEMFQDDVISSIPINGNDDVCVVEKNNYNIIQTLNYWFTYFKQTPEYNKIYNKYYKKLKWNISPYDNYIKAYAPLLKWDWRLLASLIYQESKFKAGVSSSKGAIGLMQIKESVANKYGIDNIYQPEDNIKAGVYHLKRLQDRYRNMGADSLNIIKLSLAAYNAGEGRLEDCMKVTSFHGKNPLIWDDVAQIIPLMNTKEYKVTKLGKFNGKETIRFVDNILNRYKKYTTNILE
jgi:membrane-bound lytic murein transglycosylase F